MGRHSVSLSVITDNDEDLSMITTQFAKFMAEEGGLYDQASMSTVYLDDEDAEPEDEEGVKDEYVWLTLFHIFQKNCVENYTVVDIFKDMQNAGLLLRVKPPA